MTADIVKFQDEAEKFERDRKIHRLLLAGGAPRDIAEQCACTIDQVYAAQIRLSGGVPPDFKARILQLDLERIDKLQAAFWVMALKGDVEAAKLCSRFIDQRDRLLGLYAPPMREDESENLKSKRTSSDQIDDVLAELEKEDRERIIDGEVVVVSENVRPVSERDTASAPATETISQSAPGEPQEVRNDPK